MDVAHGTELEASWRCPAAETALAVDRHPDGSAIFTVSGETVAGTAMCLQLVLTRTEAAYLRRRIAGFGVPYRSNWPDWRELGLSVEEDAAAGAEQATWAAAERAQSAADD